MINVIKVAENIGYQINFLYLRNYRDPSDNLNDLFEGESRNNRFNLFDQQGKPGRRDGEC